MNNESLFIACIVFVIFLSTVLTMTVIHAGIVEDCNNFGKAKVGQYLLTCEEIKK